MLARCAEYWLPVMKRYRIVPIWGSKYQVASSDVTHGSISDSKDDEDLKLGEDENRSDRGELNIEDILDFD